MTITNIVNNKYSNPGNEVHHFRIEFQDEQKCDSLADIIELLVTDDTTAAWGKFEGKLAGALQAHVIEGLMVFLAYQQKANVLTGQFTSFDVERDSQLLAGYVKERYDTAVIDIR